MFSYLETYEEKMLSLKVSEHTAKEEKEEGAKQLEEVGGVAHGWSITSLETACVSY